MKIVFVSDLHRDHRHEPIDWPEGDVCVVGGDSGNNTVAVLDVIAEVAAIYRYVVVVDGNHEHYSNSVNDMTVDEAVMNLVLQLPENVFMLGHHMPRVDIEGVHFVGCNGWYSFDASGDPIANRNVWRGWMNDNEFIGFDQIEQTMPWDRSVEDAALIRRTIEEIVAEGPKPVFGGSGEPTTDWPIVVVTHTAPHREMVTWTNDLGWNRSNSFFVNTHMTPIMEGDLGKRITVWYNGHTHHRRDKMIGSIYCLANPRGYPGENPHWEPVTYGVIH